MTEKVIASRLEQIEINEEKKAETVRLAKKKQKAVEIQHNIKQAAES